MLIMLQKDLEALTGKIHGAVYDMNYATTTVKEMKDIRQFSRIRESLNRAIAIQQQANILKTHKPSVLLGQYISLLTAMHLQTHCWYRTKA